MALFLTVVRKRETRRVAVGYSDKRLHLLCYIPSPDGMRVVSFRKTKRGRLNFMANPQTID